MSVVHTERSVRLRTRLHLVSRRLAALTLVAGVIGMPFIAAADCGDDIDGRRVPCACGDVVVASVRLLPDDPILSAPCGGDGLVVRPPASGGAVVIDLNGQEIVGSGTGAGIRVYPGGPVGVEIVAGAGEMRAGVRGFREGIRALADGALARVVNVTVTDSTGTGVRVRGSGARLEGVRVEGSGRDGVRTSGRSVDLLGVETERNAGRGVGHHARGGVEELDSRGNSVADRLGADRAARAKGTGTVE